MSLEQGQLARYDISLRIWHPNILPEVISRELGLEMTAGWSVGASRSAPGGTALAPHDSTYWTSTFRSGAKDDLTTLVRDLCDHLKSRVPFIQRLRATNGRIEFFVGWFVDRHSGNTLDHEDMALLGRMGVDLALDVYGAMPLNVPTGPHTPNPPPDRR